MSKTYTKLEKYMFLVGVFGQSMIYEVITTGFSYYLQSVIFVPAIVISVLFTISKVWDALKNPIMGTIVDRTHTKWGKCRPYLLFTPPIICVLTILCFTNGTYSNQNNPNINFLIVLWASVSYLVWGVVFTATDVPLWGIISLITEDELDRSSVLMAARNISNIGCGVVSFAIVYVAQFVGNMISKQIGDNTSGLKSGVYIVAFITTIIASLMYQMAAPFVKERVVTNTMEQKSIVQNFKTMWKCLPFRQLLLSGLLRSPVSVMRKVQLTLLTYYYGDNGQTPYLFFFGLLGGGYMVGQFAAIALATKLTKKIPKEKAFFMVNLLSVIPYLLLFIIYCFKPSNLHENPWLFIVFVLFTIIGSSAGMISALQSLMIADTVDYEEYYTGYRPDAVFYSLQSFLSNFSGGIASIITGVAFSIVGFSGNGVKAVNDALYAGASFKADSLFEPYRLCMFVLCTIIPSIGSLLSLIPLRKYSLPDSKYKEILNELKRRKEEI